MVHSEYEAAGTRLLVNGLTVLLEAEADPSRLLAASPGKLVRRLVPHGAAVARDQPYAEMEVGMRQGRTRGCRCAQRGRAVHRAAPRWRWVRQERAHGIRHGSAPSGGVTMQHTTLPGSVALRRRLHPCTTTPLLLGTLPLIPPPVRRWRVP